MTANHPLHDLAMAIRYDLTAAQSKLTELVRQVALLDPAAITACPLCGYRPAPNMPSLAEHMHRDHGADTPAEELALEQRITAAATARRHDLVTKGGWQLDDPELERQLRLHEAEDDEIDDLLDLAHKLRAKAVST